MFSRKFSESNGSSFTTLEPLTIESVAEKHGIEKKQVKESIIKYIKTQSIQRQKLMFEAVKKEYGITL